MYNLKNRSTLYLNKSTQSGGINFVVLIQKTRQTPHHPPLPPIVNTPTFEKVLTCLGALARPSDATPRNIRPLAPAACC